MVAVLRNEDVVAFDLSVPRVLPGERLVTEYSAIVVFSEGQWLALCPQLDIVAQADTPEDAVDQLVSAVRGALDWASEEPGRVAGEPIPVDALRDFLRSHELVAPAVNVQQIIL
jgi:predicted RNase H-like HicB family nuclease